MEGKGTTFTLRTPEHGDLTLRTPLLGDYNVHNVAGASAIALEMGMPLDILVGAVAHMAQVPGRFERVPAATAKGFEVVVDYAHTEVGLELVLDVARAVERVKKLSNAVQVVAGNVATAGGAQALIDRKRRAQA